MRSKVTLTRDRKTGAYSVKFGPDTPDREHRAFLKRLRGGDRTHHTYSEVVVCVPIRTLRLGAAQAPPAPRVTARKPQPPSVPMDQLKPSGKGGKGGGKGAKAGKSKATSLRDRLRGAASSSKP